MTLEEAKKLLKKEGFVLTKVDYESVPSDAFTKYESPDVVEAMKIVQKASYSIGMVLDEFDARKARLKKEYEAKTTAPRGDSSGRIGEGGIPLNATEGMHLKWADNKNTAENPALNESAKLFNDALLDEQAKKIEHLDELSASRNKIIVKQSKKISKLRKIIRDKDVVLSDVAEELRLSKVREENLTSTCQKYLKEIEELRKKLASIVVNNVDAQALKSAESALGYKEKIIEKLKNQLHDFQQKHFALMDERDQTVGELKAKLRNLKKSRIPTPEEAYKYFDERVCDLSSVPSVIVIPKEPKKPIEDEIMEGCKEMLRLNIKLMRDLFDE